MRTYLAVGTVLLMVMLFASSIATAADSSRIVINIAARTLSLYAGESVLKEYSIAVGRPSTPSPRGEYLVVEKIVNPWWYPTTPGMHPVPSGPENPLGYRWIGFADTYGIHGTNAPWSIGTSASKGCIRMLESDVEELFPQVTVGTPVSIKYDTIPIVKGSQGNIYVSVFPDIYGENTSTLERFREKLANVGAADLLTDAEIGQLLREETARLQKIGKLVDIYINGKGLADKGLVHGDVVLIPVTAIVQATGARCLVNNEAGTLEWQGKTVPLNRRRAGLYVKLWELPEVLGAQCAFDEQTGTASIEFVQVFYNGRPQPARLQMIEGGIALPLQVLLDATGLKVDAVPPNTGFRIAGREISVVMREGTPYLPMNRIQDELNILVHYDDAARLIHLTYVPFIASGP